MKRKIAAALVAVMTSAALAGCQLPEGELGYIPDTTAAATAPAVEAVPETLAPATVPSDSWACGDEVWWVCWDPETGGWPYPGVVLDTCDGYLIISWGWDTEGEQVFAPTSACFRSYEEAWASTGKTVVAGEDCG